MVFIVAAVLAAADTTNSTLFYNTKTNSSTTKLIHFTDNVIPNLQPTHVRPATALLA